MSKPFRYWTRLLVVSTLTASLIVSPAWAGRLLKFRKLHSKSTACCVPAATDCVPTCGENIAEVSCDPCSVTESSCVEAASDCGCSDAVTITETPIESSMSQPMEESMVAPMVEPVPSIPPAVEIPEFDTQVMPQPSVIAPPAPNVAPPAPKLPPPAPSADTAPIKPPAPPAVIESKTAPSPFADPDVRQPTAPKAPAAATDDVLDLPTAPAAPADDIFADPKPMLDDPAPAPSDDLFGTPDAATPPAMQNDIFGTPPSDPPAAEKSIDDLFGTPPATDATPSNTLDDILGTPETSTPAPADDLFNAPPAAPAADAPSELDDLFNTPAPTDAPAADKSLDDLFKSGSSLEADPNLALPVSAANGLNFDELFGSTDNAIVDETATPATDVQPSETSVQEQPLDESKDATKEVQPAVSDLNDLFSAGRPQAENEADLFAGAEHRVWVDNTGHFTVEGRLLTIYPSEVRLLKTNGRTTTVPVRRLSAGDRAYVDRVVAQLKNDSDAGTHLVHKHADEIAAPVAR